MTTLTEGRHPGEFLLSEANFHRSRDNIEIAESQTITPGQLLGAKVVPGDITAAVVPTSGNTGNGILTMANPAATSKVRNGDYLLTCTAAAANAGTFSVQTPDGREIGPATVAVAFNKEIKFTIADGSADFVVGDSIIVRVGVEPVDREYVAFNPAGTDGSETVAAIALYDAVTGVGVTTKIAAITRAAEVNGHCLTLPVGITAAQTAKAYADLAAQGIIVRN